MRPSAELIVRRLQESRRRAFLALAVRHGSAGVLVFGAGLAAAILVRGSGPPLVRTSLAVAVLVLGLSLVLAWIRVSSLAETARYLDRRLGLAQRVETAFGLLDAPDAVSTLLRRDVCRRLESLDVRVLHPLKLGLGFGAVLLAVLAIVAVALPLRQVALPRDGTGVPLGLHPVSADSKTGVAAAPLPEGIPAPPPEPTEAGDVTEPQALATATSQLEEAEPSESPGEPSAGEGGREPGAESGQLAAGDPEGPGEPAGGARADDGGPASRGATRQDAARRLSPHELDTLRLAAEEALARDDLPPALRRQVRDYFLAIRSPDEK